jgi:hypothetical protein
MKKVPCILDSAPSRRSPLGWRSTVLVLAVFSIFALAGSTFAQDAAVVPKTILSFSTMIGDPGSGPSNVIRGYSGPPVPWVLLHSVQGTLKTDGSLTVTVRGLVIPHSTPPNPVPFFRAAVSCQDPANSTKGKLFFTKTFRANTSGDSDIAGTVSLPSECIAPIVLITSPPVMGNFDGFWFAVTGR